MDVAGQDGLGASQVAAAVALARPVANSPVRVQGQGQAGRRRVVRRVAGRQGS